MKAIGTSLLALTLTIAQCAAQATINKSIPVRPGQEIEMHFDYPELVKISTWDKNEVNIQGSVMINGGENDDAFILNTGTEGQTVTISNAIRDMKTLPKRITVTDGAETIVFKDKAEYKKYQQETGRVSHDRMSWGLDMDIKLEIKVPRNTKTLVEAVYGMVEVSGFTGPLTVTATYGGVDAALAEGSTGVVTAETNYGEIFSNFDARFAGDGQKNEAFHTLVHARPGNGPDYTFGSRYGNVYIRKAD